MKAPATTPAPAAPAAEKPARLGLWLSSGLALACYALVIAALFTPLGAHGLQGGLEAALLISATIATLAALARELPFQNVVLAAVIIAVLGGGAHTLGSLTAMPFGPFGYLDNIGPRIKQHFAWPLPFIWIVILLNSRGTARLILRPWRKLKNYGFGLIGLSTFITIATALLLDPFASSIRRYWVWESTQLPLTWQGAPVSNFFGWGMIALLILAFVTPALIKKRPTSVKSRPDYHPLVAWVLMVVLFMATAGAHHLWFVVLFGALALFIVLVTAIRGARW